MERRGKRSMGQGQLETDQGDFLFLPATIFSPDLTKLGGEFVFVLVNYIGF